MPSERGQARFMSDAKDQQDTAPDPEQLPDGSGPRDDTASGGDDDQFEG
ncbi:hypothetical protein GCM10025783_00690 [Amnibacterium soli]|uniref:Uncharacterized protein n=1 Tax=Amnibacterium soli TaxID=1282736 RepID=A0ABP8YMT5_9MICO